MIFGRNIQEYRNIMRPKYHATPSLGERRNIEWRKYGKCAQGTRQAMTHIASLDCRWGFVHAAKRTMTHMPIFGGVSLFANGVCEL